MAGSFACLHYHIIFSTKNRQPWLTGDIQPPLRQYMSGVLRHRGSRVLTVGGTADHLHMLVGLHQEYDVAAAVRDVKSNSSRWLKESARLSEFGWQDGYGAFTISVGGLERTIAYIGGQEQHHEQVSFEEEFVGFLKRHGVSYDPKYIWA